MEGTLDAVVNVLFYHDTVWQGVDRAAMRDRLRLVQLSIGPCALDAITGGDGSTRTEARLAGIKGRLIATVTLDRLDGKIRSAEFRMVE